MNAPPQAWLWQAGNDLELAQLARDNGFLAQACYFASQASEKALKSAILELGEEPPHTHVLTDLLERLRVADLDISAFKDLSLKTLSRLKFTSRYPIDATPPAALFESGETDQAIATAAAVIKALQAMDEPAS